MLEIPLLMVLEIPLCMMLDIALLPRRQQPRWRSLRIQI
jgi:hypothetical protein